MFVLNNYLPIFWFTRYFLALFNQPSHLHFYTQNWVPCLEMLLLNTDLWFLSYIISFTFCFGQEPPPSAMALWNVPWPSMPLILLKSKVYTFLHNPHSSLTSSSLSSNSYSSFRIHFKYYVLSEVYKKVIFFVFPKY